VARRCELTGKGVLTGNNVSHAHNKSRRRFLPNVQPTTLMSEALGRSIRFKLSANALRTIERHGGLDNYLASAKPAVLSTKARRLKRDIAKARAASAGSA
jgi:large subunit ribosomal protein L28